MSKKKTNIKPLSNNILVEPISDENNGSKTQSGIFIPETVDKEKPDQGVIVAVGEGKKDSNGKLVPMSVKKGQKVMYTKFGLCCENWKKCCEKLGAIKRETRSGCICNEFLNKEHSEVNRPKLRAYFREVTVLLNI